VIDTGEATPVKVPPRLIPFHYAEKGNSQLREMAYEGIIRPSNNSQCMHVPKSNGELRVCVDFVQLNHVTKKVSYPVLRAEGPQLNLQANTSSHN